MPTRADLMAALKVFRPMLDEAITAAKVYVADAYNSRTTKETEIAELVGLARGLESVPGILEAGIRALPEE